MSGRVIAMWLDGFDMGVADELALPTLARLQEVGLVATLDHGIAHLTGLTGEHIATARDPDAAKRSSPVEFDPRTYDCVQVGAQLRPVFDGQRTVVFDLSYFDFDAASDDVVGVTDWGVHDPGGLPQERPTSLRAEIEERFGLYPARRWIYGNPWSSPRGCAAMGKDITAAVDARSRIVRWLLGERFDDWTLAVIGITESHSVSEAFFHGVDPDHPWASLASAPQAGDALRSVYRAIDRAVGDIVESFPDDTVVVFSMHGMGPNSSDVPSMALLGELLARWSGVAVAPMTPFPVDQHGIPQLPADAAWTSAVLSALSGAKGSHHGTMRRVVKRLVPVRVRRVLRRARQTRHRPPPRSVANTKTSSLHWMPVMRHQSEWPTMKAFAIPSFYDGRIRVNLQGRESSGVVPREDFDRVLDDIETVLRACVEPRTGQPVIETIQRCSGDPLHRLDDEVDMIVYWAPNVLGFSHPDLGTMGPFPPRRMGGHTKPTGRCVIVGPTVEPGHLGTHSSFDVMATVLNLAGMTQDQGISGQDMLARR